QEAPPTGPRSSDPPLRGRTPVPRRKSSPPSHRSRSPRTSPRPPPGAPGVPRRRPRCPDSDAVVRTPRRRPPTRPGDVLPRRPGGGLRRSGECHRDRRSDVPTTKASARAAATSGSSVWCRGVPIRYSLGGPTSQTGLLGTHQDASTVVATDDLVGGRRLDLVEFGGAQSKVHHMLLTLRRFLPSRIARYASG